MSYVATLTVPAGKVASALTSFVTRVDLSHMPADWWTDTTSDLGNVRVKSAGTVIPFDIVTYDRTAKTGELFFKASLTTSANTFTVETVNGATALAATDTNGRNAVWSDYDAVAVAPAAINRVNGNALTMVGTVSTSGSMWSFPGGGGGYYHTGNVLTRRTSYTFGASYVPSDVTGDKHFTSYGPIGTSNTVVATIATTNNFIPRAYAPWNSTASFSNSGVEPISGERRRAIQTYVSGTSRTLFIDGVQKVTGAGVARPGGTGNVGLFVGTGVQGSSNSANGLATYFYVRGAILSNDWIAAEYASWETPASFYTITPAAITGTLDAHLPGVQVALTGTSYGPISGTLDAKTPGIYADLAGTYNGPVSVAWLWAGAVTDTGFTVAAKVTAGDSVRLATQSGNLATLTAPTLHTAATADADGYVKVSATGLTADAAYTYALQVNGSLDTNLGHATTYPAAGTAHSFRFAHASCMQTGTNHRVFDAIAARSPLFFMQLGDLHYRDYNGTTAATRRGHYDSIFTKARPKALWQSVPVPYMWDDHDFCGENSNGSAAGKATAQTVYRQIVPHYPLDDATSLYYWFQVGRVAFIVTDLRSERSSDGATDDSSKTMMGATQKTWFKSALLDADAAGAALIVWVSTNVYSGHGTTGINYDNDQWAAFTTERTELANYIRDNGLTAKTIIISGDAHMIAQDNGSNTDFATGGGAGVPEFVAAALDRTGIQRGDHWSAGAYPGGGQYAVFDITDDGDTITWAWNAYRVNATTGVETTILSITNAPDAGGTVTVDWWDGEAMHPATVAGWWDGSAIQPVTTLGWWDGSAIQSVG